MSVHRNRTPRMAALFLSIAVGGATLTMVPAAQAAPHIHIASGHHAQAAVAVETVVTRLSAAKGLAGDTILIQGAKLATGSVGSWTKKAVKFGDVTVTASDVTVLSAGALLVEVPDHANGAVVVTVGDAVKGPKFTYAAPITVSTDQDALDDVHPVSETGLVGASVSGTNFTTATKVLVGGKAVKVAKVGGVTATKITFDYPLGLTGVQDVTVVDGGVTHLVGYVTYAGKPVTITTATGSPTVEQGGTVDLVGTNLDLVTTVTYNGEKATFKKTTDATKLTVTVAKGTAVSGALVVTTKYGETATKSVARAAAPVPTVSAISTVTVATAGEVTLTGTNLTGLKTVTVKSAAGKSVNGTKFTVAADGLSAKVTLPALTAGEYTVVVTTVSATPSTAKAFTVAAAAVAPTVTAAVSTDGLTITITGTGFTGATKVDFTPGTGSAVSVTTGITVNSATSITVVLSPALANETYDVKVTTPAGNGTGTDKLVVNVA